MRPSYADWARALDDPGEHDPGRSPGAARRKIEDRPHRISVTEVDTLKADPFAFYARKRAQAVADRPVDADPSPAWRGNQVHAILQDWFEKDGAAPCSAAPALRETADRPTHAPDDPRACGGRGCSRRSTGWPAKSRRAAVNGTMLAVEGRGTLELFGVELTGRFDRIDQRADGTPGRRRLQDRPAAVASPRCARGSACNSGCSG